MNQNLAILQSMLDSTPKYGGKRVGELMDERYRVLTMTALESGSVVTVLSNGEVQKSLTVFPNQATDLVLMLGFVGGPEEREWTVDEILAREG